MHVDFINCYSMYGWPVVQNTRPSRDSVFQQLCAATVRESQEAAQADKGVMKHFPQCLHLQG